MGRFFDIITSSRGRRRPNSAKSKAAPLRPVKSSEEAKTVDSVDRQLNRHAADNVLEIIELTSAKEVWFPIHSNRVVAISGKIKNVVKTPASSHIQMNNFEAFLDDGTTRIRIKWLAGGRFEWDHRNIYRVEGVCDTDDSVYSYLKDCKVTVLQRPQHTVIPIQRMATHENSAAISSSETVSTTSYKDAAPSANQHTSMTGANWTREIKGQGVRSDSSWQRLRSNVFKRDKYRCVQCSETENLTVDHIQPLSLGGTNRMDNLQTLCADCHEDKHFVKFLSKAFNGNDNYGENYRLSNKMRAVTSAIKYKKPITIVYQDSMQVTTTRTIRPSRIYKGYRYKGKAVCINCVYIDGFCELKNDNRTFRLSRVKRII